MVQILTFIGVLLSFAITTVLCEKQFQKKPPQYGLLKVLLGNICIEFILLTLVVFIPKLFPILIYGSVMIASFVCSYSRHRRIGMMAE